MSTYACEFCGEPLDFRVIRGATVPLHPAKSHCEGKKHYRTENLNRCIRTHCPQCNNAHVFFVRHNGGSVWFDSVGWPWKKHKLVIQTDDAAVTLDGIVLKNDGPYVSSLDWWRR